MALGAVIEIGGVGLFTALFAGMLSFLSPCVLPLVPGYLSAVTGVAASGSAEGGLAQGHPPRAALRRLLLGDLHHPRALGDGSQPGAAHEPDDAQQGRRARDHRDGRLLRRLALHHPPERRVAGRRADGARRPGRAADRRRRVRDRLDALHRADPDRDPRPRQHDGLRLAGRGHARRLLARARDPVPAHGDRVHADDDRLRLRQAPLRGADGDRRRLSDRHGRASSTRTR